MKRLSAEARAELERRLEVLRLELRLVEAELRLTRRCECRRRLVSGRVLMRRAGDCVAVGGIGCGEVLPL